MNRLLFVFLTLFIFNSCAIKNITKKEEIYYSTQNVNELISRVNFKNNKSNWINFKGRAKVLQKGSEISANVNIKNIIDSIIFISASGPFGIELMRAKLTPDSIYFINRIAKSYFTEPISQMQDIIGNNLSFYYIQELITGTSNISKRNYNFLEIDSGFYLTSADTEYYINKNYRIINYKSSGYNKSFELIYDMYNDLDAIPRMITINFTSTEFFQILLNYSSIEFKEPKNLLFKIPDSYVNIN